MNIDYKHYCPSCESTITKGHVLDKCLICKAIYKESNIKKMKTICSDVKCFKCGKYIEWNHSQFAHTCEVNNNE